MKKFRTTILLLIIICLLLVLSTCDINKPLRTKMYTYYSNDNNYVILTGIVASKYDNGSVVGIKITTENHTITRPKDNGIFVFYVYCTDIEDIDSLSIGDEIVFTTAAMYFYNGHILPIVSLEKEGEIYLEYEIGKANLLNWILRDGFND